MTRSSNTLPFGHARPQCRVAGQHVGQGAGLLVLHVLLGVGRLAERRVHEVAVAEQADLAAARDLAAGIGGRQVADLGLRRRRGGLHAHGIELHGARARTGSGTRHRDGIGRGELVGQARSGEELAQRLLRRHRAVHAAARLAGDSRRIDGDLHAGLAAERRQRLRQRLRGDVEIGGAACLRLERRFLRQDGGCRANARAAASNEAALPNLIAGTVAPRSSVPAGHGFPTRGRKSLAASERTVRIARF